MKKTVIVHSIDIEKPVSEQSGLGESISEVSISRIFERVREVHRIDEISWKDYPYLPEVTFKIARTAKGLLLKYDVREEYIRAMHGKTNDPVYEDSCVEFFLSSDDRHYYNFEFNCIGTALIGFGTSREDRKWIDPERIKQISRFPSMGRKPFPEGAKKKGPYRWELSVYIPFGFFREAGELQSGFSGRKIIAGTVERSEKTYRANFYKCGDKLPLPHYVSWNRIETKAPDFHRPEYFGDLIFKD